MPNPDRPKVGPADPETRRKKLAEVLGTPTKGEGVAAKKPTMLDAVNAGVEEGTESDTLPNGQKRRAKATKAAKRDLVRRFGPNGKTEDEIEAE
jgi:hypothetical protein